MTAPLIPGVRFSAGIPGNRRREQDLFLRRREADQAGDDLAQPFAIAHGFSSFWPFRARNISVSVTVSVISAKPSVWSRVRNAAGSTGL